MTDKVVVITNGNDDQVPLISVMVRSFRAFWDIDAALEFVVVSDHLSDPAIAQLTGMDIRVDILPDDVLDRLNGSIASNAHALGKVAKPFFLQWALEQMPEGPLYIYADPDSLMVAGMSRLLALHRPGQVTVSQSLLPTIAHHCVRRLQKAVDAGQISDLLISRIKPEVCTGFFLAERGPFMDLLQAWTGFMLSEPFNANKDTNDFGFGWHDQDFFRCYFAINPDLNLNILSPTDIAITNPPATTLYSFALEGDDLTRIKVTWPRATNAGVMLHFAGGTYKDYPDIAALYARAGAD
ncbi:hypothetical protein ACRARG_05930 [Pseudooceanicola sp. C21-150M6]|uniref:hypothetical protein n=1 Tax=Pseudooceanicola sp. C21-150M6 TaxID=3434355 RepID=UPI003D7F9422